MSAQSRPYTGGCMCGAVRFEIDAEPHAVVHCHCKDCRRHSGAPVTTYVGFKGDQVRYVKGERKIFSSSPGVGRAFCADCGSTLTWEGDWPRLGILVEVHIGAFDDPELFVPSKHMMYPKRISWFDVADGLPRYASDPNPELPPLSSGPAKEGLPG